MAHQTRRDYFESRRTEMTTERQSFISHYKLLSDNIQPRRGRFHPADRNKGVRRHNNINMESKRLMQERGVKSPDIADALALTFAEEVALLARPEGVGPAQPTTIFEYDPLEDNF